MTKKSTTARIFIMITIILALVVCGCSREEAETDTPISFLFHDFYSETKPEEQLMVDLVNITRRELGLNDLLVDKEIYYIATDRNIDMVIQGYIDHAGIFGVKAELVIIGLSKVGENLGFGYTSVESAYAAFLRSDGHFQIIIRENYKYVSISILYDSEGRMYIVQLFVC